MKDGIAWSREVGGSCFHSMNDKEIGTNKPHNPYESQ